MNYITVIGLEIHVQLKTNTKIFCGCKNEFGADPNTYVCPVCLGLPGTLPVINKKVLAYSVKAGLGLGCEISKTCKMDRKNYFYPDLPKAFQISQFDQPICGKGSIEVEVNGEKKEIGITRAHIEEDAGKLVHSEKGDYSQVDYNRTGVPLLEIVSEPDIRSAQEAYEYLSSIKAIMEYLEVSDCNMQEGSLRCDVNISLMPEGATEFGIKAEIKNMNSFKAVVKAIDHEVKRQTDLLNSGGEVVQETRLWDADKEKTFSMRSKEEAHDYRYFPEPDIMTIFIDEKMVQDAKDNMPELPKIREQRFIEQYGLPEYDAHVLTAEKQLADYYEEAAKLFDNYKVISNWVMGQLLAELNNAKLEVKNSPVLPADLVELIKLVANDTVSHQNAKSVFEEMFKIGKKAQDIVKEKGLEQISDSSELEDMIKGIIEANPKAVEEYKSGQKKAMGFFIGQVMYKTEGKANPGVVSKMISEMLDSI